MSRATKSRRNPQRRSGTAFEGTDFGQPVTAPEQIDPIEATPSVIATRPRWPGRRPISEAGRHSQPAESVQAPALDVQTPTPVAQSNDIEPSVTVIEAPVRQPHVPSGPVPTMGWRGLFWKLLGHVLYSRYGWRWLVKRSYRERFAVARQTLWINRKTQKIVAFANSKGGAGKTPCAVWLSTMLAWAIRAPVLAFDANENSGHTADGFDIARTSTAKDHPKSKQKGFYSTIELREYLNRCERSDFDNLENLLQEVDWDPETGVMVIASDPASNIAFTQAAFEKGLLVAKQNVHSVFCDLGNGIPHAANLGSVNRAATLVYPGNVNSPKSLDDIDFTMDRYTQLGYPTKVKNGVIVILGDKLRNRKKYADRYGYPEERVFVIPPNRYMKSGKQARMSKVPRKIQTILLEILVAIMTAEIEGVEYLPVSQLVAPATQPGTSLDPATVHANGHNGSTPE